MMLFNFDIPNFVYLLINCVCNQMNYSTENHFKIGQYMHVLLLSMQLISNDISKIIFVLRLDLCLTLQVSEECDRG